jgi:hypothetical protein
MKGQGSPTPVHSITVMELAGKLFPVRRLSQIWLAEPKSARSKEDSPRSCFFGKQ